MHGNVAQRQARLALNQQTRVRLPAFRPGRVAQQAGHHLVRVEGAGSTPVTFAQALIAQRDRATVYEAVRSRFESWWVRCRVAGQNPASAPRAVAQLAAQGPHKAPVGGSNPPCTTVPQLGWFEHPADTREVGGSSPPGTTLGRPSAPLGPSHNRKCIRLLLGHGCRFDSCRVSQGGVAGRVPGSAANRSGPQGLGIVPSHLRLLLFPPEGARCIDPDVPRRRGHTFRAQKL